MLLHAAGSSGIGLNEVINAGQGIEQKMRFTWASMVAILASATCRLSDSRSAVSVAALAAASASTRPRADSFTTTEPMTKIHARLLPAEACFPNGAEAGLQDDLSRRR